MSSSKVSAIYRKVPSNKSKSNPRWLRQEPFYTVCGRLPVQILAGSLINPALFVHGFLKSLQENSKIKPQVKPGTSPCHPMLQSDLLTAL
jgi:hypothetical protein